MPIKDKSLYPPNWKDLRRQVLLRADNRCEFCGVENHTMVERQRTVKGVTESYQIKVVLTIAHLDQDPTHNDLDNLRALCQRCHLRYDAEQHKRNAAQTRKLKRIGLNQDQSPTTNQKASQQ